jgi:para-nitrobenzyl esterase
VPGKDPAILSFKGIPFAAPPVGDLRWRAPQPAPDWQGVKLADKFSGHCQVEAKSGRFEEMIRFS